MALMRVTSVARPLIPSSRQPMVLLRTFFTTPALHSSSVLPRLKADLKDAMRSKDKPRLNVLRSLMAEITNASKTPKPIDSDAKLLALLRKQMVSAERAIAEFENANRDDLVEKERGQVGVMQAYVDDIPVLEKGEVNRLVDHVVTELRGEAEEGWKPPFGALMKGVMAKIEGRPVDQTYVTERIKSLAA